MELLTNYFQLTLDYLVILIDKIGYLGIFIGMFLESSFFPFPSEIIMVPAGVAASYGKFNIYLVIICGTAGSLSGAIFNYSLAFYFGRPILFKIGKFFFISEKTINKFEKFFNDHGSFSTFTGRLVPGIRQYISLPAGIAKMNFGKFCLYTFAGSAIWVTILTYLGFLIGENKELIKQYLHIAVLSCLTLCILFTLVYIWFVKRKKVQTT
ncbi:MAG: membrane protein DedA with SNARE-associated domain [Rickettsiales bacterium]|jgi:membrane protein DedA with SNARE-associated domain